MEQEGQSDNWSWVAGLAVGVTIMALLVAAYEIGYHRSGAAGGGGGGTTAPAPTDGGKAAAPGGATKPAGGGQAASGPGKQVFAQSCGTCHTLSDAGTKGAVGPNLDQIKLDAKRVLEAIKNGGTGSGTMPVNIVTGSEAKQVADYVAAVAGGG